MAEIKRLLLLMFLLALMTMGAVWDKEINWVIVYMPWEQDALELEITELKGELATANEKVALVDNYDSLTAQIASMHSQIGSLGQVSSSINGQLQTLRSERDALRNSMAAFTALPKKLGQTYPGRTIWADQIGCTGSMVPTVTCADLNIMLAYPTPSEIQVGDPIVYKMRWGNCIDWDGNTYILHRVVSIDGDGNYIARGDANGGNDPCPVPHADVISKGLDPIKNFWPERWGND